MLHIQQIVRRIMTRQAVVRRLWLMTDYWGQVIATVLAVHYLQSVRSTLNQY